jgi:hypothetical protein
MPKKYYYEGKLYKESDWDNGKKKPLEKAAKVKEPQAIEIVVEQEIEEVVVEQEAVTEDNI